MKGNKIDHIIFLRALTIILVVFAHATRSSHSPNPHMYSPLYTPWWEVTVKNYIYSFHMQLFFWISGFVFYFTTVERKKQTTITRQIIAKVKRLIVPLYSTSFLVLLPTIIVFGNVNESITNQIKLFILGLDNDHLWFLRSLFVIFIIIIPFYRIIKQERMLFYLGLFLCSAAIFFINLPFGEPIQSSLKYFPFFIAGCLSKRYEHIVFPLNNRLFFTLFFLLHTALILAKEFLDLNLPFNALWYLISFCGIYFMYFGISILTKKILKSGNIWERVKIIDESSYTIYLFHITFLYITLYISRKIGIEAPSLRIFIATTGIFLPIYIQRILLSKSKILSFAFGAQYKEGKHMTS